MEARTASETAAALVLRAPETLERTTLPLPEIGPGDALLRVEACGLCGTDHEQFTGTLPIREAFVPGHEIVGTIERIGDEARRSRGLAPGDRVAVEVFHTCGACEACRSGAHPLCRAHGLRDSYGMATLTMPPGLWGGYATHVFLPPTAVVHRVPPGLDPVEATLFNPLGAGIRWATTLPRIRPGAVVAVLGPGLRGLCAVRALRRAGAGFILLTGAGPRDASRLELGKRLGASVTVDVTQDDPVKVLKRESGGRADVVVDVTAAAPEAFLQAIDLVRTGGTVVIAGMRGSALVERFNPDWIAIKEITMIGARGVTSDAYAAALDVLVEDDLLRAVPRRTAGLDPDEVAALLDEMAHGTERPLHAVIVPQR
ncbi:MAG TPA: zinc-binding dehydrogenase [Candidatus Binatia bacterium]